MDIGKLLKNVNNLNQYVETTHDALENCKSSRMQLNLTSVLALKKIRSLEIEYFNKCEGNGLACIIIERLLLLPASKTWGVLGKELVNLLQYWLDAIRKHLIRHNVHWWAFLKLLIKFIKEIRVKDASLPNLLIEHTAECLLDLATLKQPDPHQKYEILHCFNVYCSESSREIRFALRNKFAPYFIKLAQYMASCGHLPTQYSVMEALIRWLLPRQDRTLRVMSANKWFPNHLYDDDTVNIFLERQWVNFFHDARDFLNSHNEKGEFITSVVCRKLTVGKLEIGTRRLESYLDINCVTRCVSVLLDPKVLETFATRHNGFETLVITHDNTETATLDRDSLQLKLSIRTITPPLAVPSYIPLGDHCDVIAVVTSHCDVTKLINALRTVFVDKYQTTFDLDKEIVLSPVKPIEDGNRNTTSEEENRFSLPVEAKTRKKSGYVQYSRQHRSTNLLSPSTASTSSLLHLREKLAALPKYRFEKEPVSVCVQPELSIVSEASETESLNTTLKKKHYGVISFQRKQDSDKKSQSDSESVKSVLRNKPRRLSPVIDEYGPSLLLYATIGSAGDSVIDDTVEQLTKNKDFDPESIVDLLVKEALQTPADETGNDSGINTAENKLKQPEDEVNSETIENTPNTEVNVKKCIKNKSKIISCTSDESNTEGINNTPKCYINTRLKKKVKINTLPALDEQVVGKLFSQHTDKRNEILISPTLAKRINETSSETSDNFCQEECNLIADLQDNIEAEIFNNIDVIECLNHMVDKVCDELEKCTKYLGEDDNNTSDRDDNLPLREIINRIQCTKAKDSESQGLKPTRAKKTMKLKYKSKTRKDNTRAKKGNKNIEPIPPKMSTIIEADDTIIEKDIPENTENEPDKNQPNKDEDNVKKQIVMDKVDVETPQIRRKRKLFSPKDDDTNKDNKIVVAEEERISGEFQIKKTPKKSLATCYKDIERERQNRIRMPRSRRSKIIESPISPRTKKMNDIFDQVKDSANNETVTLADRTYEYDVYNLTTDSEDDFKQKKIAISKTSSVNSVRTTRRARVIKPKMYDDKSTDECKPTKRRATRKPRGKKQGTQNDLIDERMRKEKDDLNTSIVIENTSNPVEEPKLILDVQPAMEIIEVNESKPDCQKSKKKVTQNKVKRVQPSRQKQQLEVKYIEDDRTESPLPGLIVEAVPENKEDLDISADLVDKLKKIYQEGPETYINESNTTQNLLSDVERVNYSPINVEMAVNMEEEEPEQMRQSQHKIRRNYKTAKGENTTTSLPKKKCTKIDKYDPVEKSNPKQRVLKDITTDINNKHTNATSKIITRCNRNTAIDVINISEDVTSDKSIASIGITGHGDYEEAPPSLKLLAENFKGRSLETEYLDVSMKDYFEKLSQEIQKSNRSSSLDKDFRKISKNKPKSYDSVSSKSAVVQITGLTSDDISRWLPSNKNSSDSDSYVRETEQNTRKSFKDDKTLKSSQTKSKINKTSDSTNEYTKTTNETMDFDKIIQLHDESINGSQAKRKHDSNSTTKLQECTKSNQNSNDTEESNDEQEGNNRKSIKLIYKLSQLTKHSKRCKDNDSENSDTSIKHTNKKKKPSVNTKLKCKTSKLVENKSKEKVKLTSNKDESVSSKSNRQNTSKNINTKDKSKIRSTISPIKLLDELISNANNQSCSLSDDESYMKEIIETFTKDTSQKRCVETKNRNRNATPEIEMAEEKSITSLSTVSKVNKREDSRTIKRKSVEEGGSRQKIRVLSEEGISASAATVSSVDDWFKRNDPIVMGRSEALPDIIQPVLEKLDTTLVEINQRTSKEFVRLFVETQQDLTALNEQRYNLYKQTASDIMSEFIKLAVKVMDEKFSDLTRRTEELDKKFLIRQKERASRVIREDCKQKRAMVKLLREDVQAVVDHLQKQGEL